MDEKSVSKSSHSASQEPKAEDPNEIEKIMNEIHELQGEITASVVPQKSLPDEPVLEEEVVEDDSALKRAMPHLHRKVLEDSQGTAMTMDQLMESVPEPEPLRPTAESSAQESRVQNGADSLHLEEEAAVSLTLHGKTRLNIKYEFGEKDVTIQFQEERLSVQLSDGTEFNFNLSSKNKNSGVHKSQTKKAA